MRLKPGAMIIAGERDLDDAYLCAVIEADKDTDERNPLVRVGLCLRYPMQTAIVDKSIVMERRSIEPGTVTRLKMISFAEVNNAEAEAEEPPVSAIRRRMAETEDEAIRAILTRHLTGEYGCKPRLILRLKEWEIPNANRQFCK